MLSKLLNVVSMERHLSIHATKLAALATALSARGGTSTPITVSALMS